MEIAVVTAILFALVVLVETGYVDLFKDADFKNKITRVEDVVIDVCYNFKCAYGSSSLDNSITSAKWHGVPEKGQFFGNGDATIKFYTDLDCKGGREGGGRIVAYQDAKQEEALLPGKLPLRRNDAISSFKVINAGGVAGVLNVCVSPESAIVANAPSYIESSASFNDTDTFD